jgi:hypothetical protein
MESCQSKHKKKHYRFGTIEKIQCKKEHTNQDESGRLLCKHHFNKWFKKKYNQNYDEFIKK